ncbi:hypothetical protein [Metarhizobium album]|uniref:hypothetical protein n=1 Tax=Metarhizobium album TaxID=2182425 RepID=UPI000FFEE46F|nr:hypothetical protein [Rhizobium album]
MKTALLLAASLLASTQASAACYGTRAYQNCYDDSGNTYTINRYGNTTHMYGNNSRTGSNWSQDSYSFGNSVNHYGRDSDGNNWSSTCYNGTCY